MTSPRHNQVAPVPPLTPVAKYLVIACVAFYFIDFLLTNLGITIGGLTFPYIFGLVPDAVFERGWVWQFATYLFVHGHPWHLLFNMLILWYFGSEIEMRMGSRRFLLYYMLCGVGAGVFNFIINHYFSSSSAYLSHPIIGSSGAVYGLLAAYGVFFGNRYFLAFFLFPMKAKYFVLIIAAVELILGVEASARDNVAHFAHLGGMLVGLIYLYFTYMRPPSDGSKRNYERERLKRQFTLIVNQNEDSEKDKGPYWN